MAERGSRATRNQRQPEWDRVLLAGVLISRHVWTLRQAGG